MDLNHAATFVRVVEAGSFTAAAATLRLPTSSVSRSVSRLEGELGVALLERTTRRIGLTDAGRVFYERAREAVAGLGEASALAGDAAREPIGVVRLAVPPDFGGRLAGVIGEFARRYPRVLVDVTFTGRGAELVGDAVDLAIVVGRLDDSSLIVKKIGTSTQRLFAAPEYLARRGRPRSIADLARHDVVLYRGRAGVGVWELTGPHGRETVEVRGRIGGDQLAFVLEATLGGHGIALLATFLAEPALAGGRLVPVLPRYAETSAMQLLVNPSRHLPRRVALLRDFLAAALPRECPRS
jgi:DNA-binding transcriptional LysR family regulator